MGDDGYDDDNDDADADAAAAAAAAAAAEDANEEDAAVGGNVACLKGSAGGVKDMLAADDAAGRGLLSFDSFRWPRIMLLKAAAAAAAANMHPQRRIAGKCIGNGNWQLQWVVLLFGGV